MKKLDAKNIIIVSLVVTNLVLVGFFFAVQKENKKKISKESSVNIQSSNLGEKMEEVKIIAREVSKLAKVVGIEREDINELSVEDRLIVIKEEAKNYMDTVRAIPSAKPMKHIRVTDEYGYRIHPITKKKSYHTGTDYRAAVGTKVYATADGKVTVSKAKGKGYLGNYIELSHNMGFKTYYGHLSKIIVKKGSTVRQGELIGYSGNTGRSNGPHLHYGIKFAGTHVNPEKFIR